VKAWFAFVLMTSASAAVPGETAIEFTGVLSTSGSVRLALRDRTTGVSSPWLKVGDTFSGYALTAFEPASETVVLTRDSNVTRVKLSPPKTNAVVTEPLSEIAAAILTNLRQLVAAADQHYLETPTQIPTLADLVGETKYVRRLLPVDGEDYGALQFTPGNRTLTVQTAHGQTVTLDRDGLRPATHQIRAGETLAYIARTYGMGTQELAKLNDVVDPSKLRPGQTLRLK
jgi:hypothetical protein